MDGSIDGCILREGHLSKKKSRALPSSTTLTWQ